MQGASRMQEDSGFEGRLHIAYQKTVAYLRTAPLPALPDLVQKATQVDRKQLWTQAQKTEKPLEALSSLEKEAMQIQLEDSLPNPIPLRAELQRSLLNLQTETKQMKLLETILGKDMGATAKNNELSAESHPQVYLVLQCMHRSSNFSTLSELRDFNRTLEKLNTQIQQYQNHP